MYVCGAEANKPTADRLLEELEHHRIGTFYPHTDLLPGDQILERVEEHLGSSDYFLLVWSRACVDHPAVHEEWAAYVITKVRKKQGFLFVMRLDNSRLDNSRLPALLEIRRQLNAFEDWDAAVAELLECCSRDRALELPVLPAPEPAAKDGRPTVMLYIRNRFLGVSHVMAVPKNSTGASLLEEIRRQLMLPDDSSHPLGPRMEFEYQPFLNEIAILRDSHVEVGLTDNTVIDLQVKAYYSVKDDKSLLGEYRPILREALSPPTRDRLLRKAFGHLLPHDR